MESADLFHGEKVCDVTQLHIRKLLTENFKSLICYSY